MSEAWLRYCKTLEQLSQSRLGGHLSDDARDELEADLDSHWHELTAEEQLEARRRYAEGRSLGALENLSCIDTELPVPSVTLPRHNV